MGDLTRLLTEKDSGLTEDEVFGILFQVLVGANETTVAAIGSALLLSAQFPDVFATVSKNQTLIPNYLEEVLRRETPAQGNYRKTTVDTKLAGVTIPAGSTLTLLWAAANRDENEFENPEQLIIDRPNIKNHLGFGQGIHFCVGAALARLETRVAMEAFLATTGGSTVSLVEEPVTYIPSLFIRRLARLNVRFS
jgi:cytochrome P450